ncbi:hypothetical protein CLV63_101368 [Murinocardiopsis flavida]|uniref:Uncharacterized protein n=1 Tax=Murinocardiopsis flavida TaxID=645275 RepID=A0A2P8DUI8_9ACTN|nr:hypothetical protein [Murinocardiopsis flavida]PSL00889.1 hypothetical protein CLV63_101368 [Murinocardiopsis flavida]
MQRLLATALIACAAGALALSGVPAAAEDPRWDWPVDQGLDVRTADHPHRGKDVTADQCAAGGGAVLSHSGTAVCIGGIYDLSRVDTARERRAADTTRAPGSRVTGYVRG